MKKLLCSMALAALACACAASAQDDVILEDGVFMEDTGMDPIFSTPSTMPPVPEDEGDFYSEIMMRPKARETG